MTKTNSSFGNIRRLPSGQYQARYTVGRDTHRAPTTFRTKRDAADWLAAERTRILAGNGPAPAAGSITLAESAVAYLAGAVHLKPKTLKLYRSVFDRYVATCLADPVGGPAINLGATPLRDIDLPLIRRWHNAATQYAARSAAKRSRRTVNPVREWARRAGYDVADTGRIPERVHVAYRAAGSPAPDPTPYGTGRTQVAQAYRVVRMLCNVAIDDGVIRGPNPCRIKGAGTTKPVERAAATPAQVAAIAAAMPEHLFAAVHVGAYGALRAGELFALDRSRVDLDAGTVHVDRTVTGVRGGVATFGTPKTASSRRTVALPPHVVVILAEHMATHTGADPDSLVFVNAAGGPVSQPNYQRAFVRARNAADLPNLRWHDLRHTGATWAARAGASVRDLQHRLGHATAHAAMIYQHTDADRDRDIATRMSDLVTGVAS